MACTFLAILASSESEQLQPNMEEEEEEWGVVAENDNAGSSFRSGQFGMLLGNKNKIYFLKLIFFKSKYRLEGGVYTCFRNIYF